MNCAVNAQSTVEDMKERLEATPKDAQEIAERVSMEKEERGDDDGGLELTVSPATCYWKKIIVK